MGEHDQQSTGEQDQQKQLSSSEAAEAEADRSGRAEGEEETEEPPAASEGFVDKLTDEDEWEVLNAQKDVALHLHSQTTRFFQLVFTLVGLVLTGIAVLGPSAIAASLLEVNISTVISAIGRVNTILIGTIILRHVYAVFLNAFTLVFSVGIGLVRGLTIHPAVGDNKTHPAGTTEWIRANQNQLNELNDTLSDGYSDLFWLSLHALIAVFLYYGVLYLRPFLMFGLPISFGVMSVETLMRVFPESPDEQEEFIHAYKNNPFRLFWTLVVEEYQMAVNETDSRIGTWRHFLRHGGHFVWLFVHGLLVLGVFVLLIVF